MYSSASPLRLSSEPHMGASPRCSHSAALGSRGFSADRPHSRDASAHHQHQYSGTDPLADLVGHRALVLLGLGRRLSRSGSLGSGSGISRSVLPARLAGRASKNRLLAHDRLVTEHSMGLLARARGVVAHRHARPSFGRGEPLSNLPLRCDEPITSHPRRLVGPRSGAWCATTIVALADRRNIASTEKNGAIASAPTAQHTGRSLLTMRL